MLDYSKYKYEQAQKVKQARKHQQQITVREIKFRPKIAEHDYDTKKHHVERFLRHKDKVKVTIMFRGREVTHPERGTAILDRLAEELQELGVVEQRPMQEGRNMTMMMAPSKAVLAGRLDGEARADEGGSPTPPPEVAGEANPEAAEVPRASAGLRAQRRGDAAARGTGREPPAEEAAAPAEQPSGEAARPPSSGGRSEAGLERRPTPEAGMERRPTAS